MRTLDAGIETEAASVHYTACHLIEIVGEVATYRYTDFTSDVVYAADTYTRLPFLLGNVVTDGQGQQATTVTFEDQAQVVKALAFLYDFKDWPVTISELWFDDAGAQIAVVIILEGVTDGCGGNEEGTASTVDLHVIDSLSPVGQDGPRRRYTPGCGWVFKGPRCGYAGGETECDRSYVDCLVKVNTHRFGGFRFMLPPGTIVRWGNGAMTLTQRNDPNNVNRR